jgi:phage minor structural protein
LLQTKDTNCFLNRWGGEIERDNYTVKMLTRKGADRGVSIRYRKNLTGLIARSDLTNVKTRIYPTGLTEKDAVLEIDSKYVDSDIIALWMPHP